MLSSVADILVGIPDKLQASRGRHSVPGHASVQQGTCPALPPFRSHTKVESRLLSSTWELVKWFLAECGCDQLVILPMFSLTWTGS
jgi:hypothetical protein